MAKKERFPFIVQDNGFLKPDSGFVVSRMTSKGYKKGDLLLAVLTKPRKYWYNKYAHKIGQMVQKNIDGFEYLDPHSCLKRLQIESGAGCEEIVIKTSDGMQTRRIPKSLSYDSMDQGEYEEVVKALCRYISWEYWPDLKPEKIEEMAELMPDDV